MNSLIKQRMLQGRLVLFLGAGASVGCKDRAGHDAAPLANQLKQDLTALAGLEESDEEDLQDTFAAATRILGSKVQQVLESRYSKLIPSQELKVLASYVWARVYTTNIDDAFYTALVAQARQKITPRSRSTASTPVPENLSVLDLVFLNGYVNWPRDGYLFSAMEYARAQAAHHPWFVQLVRDFFDYTFLFIGTRLKESTFYYHLAQHAQTTGNTVGRSFLLIPSISAIQKERLPELNIEALNGSLSDFVRWLEAEFPSGLTKQRVLQDRMPILRLFERGSFPNVDVSKLDGVDVIERSLLSKARGTTTPEGSGADFFKGFKPSWEDIVSGVPAEFEILNQLLEHLDKSKTKVTLVRGPTGSGKTTLLILCKLH